MEVFGLSNFIGTHADEVVVYQDCSGGCAPWSCPETDGFFELLKAQMNRLKMTRFTVKSFGQEDQVYTLLDGVRHDDFLEQKPGMHFPTAEKLRKLTIGDLLRQKEVPFGMGTWFQPVLDDIAKLPETVLDKAVSISVRKIVRKIIIVTDGSFYDIDECEAMDKLPQSTLFFKINS